MSRPSTGKDLTGAVLLLALGLAVTIAGFNYHLGSLSHMGAGFVPTVLGSLMMLVGLAIGLGAWFRREAGVRSASLPAEWRGWFCILGGVVAFVVLGEHGGLVPASFACVFISALGDRKNSWRDALLLALLMTVFGLLVFHWGLRLQLPLFTWN